MMSSMEVNAQARRDRTSMVAPILVGCGAFAVGAVLTFGFVQWKAQQQQLALMTQMVQQLGQQPVVAPQVAPQIAATPEVVTRNEPINLLTLSSDAAAAAAATPEVAPVVAAPVVAPAAEPAVVAAPAPEPVQSTADKLRTLVAAANAPKVAEQPQLDSEMVKNARRFETLAIIHAGVQELVTAVVDGEYDIHTNYEDEDFSGRIHFAFVGHEEDQAELERFLANAAESGIVAHSKSVVDGDGSVNGHILLFELVERALQNGTLVEQQAGQKMRSEALAMLAKDTTVGEAADSAGNRYYTVETGDSLAYIALQFYGNTNEYRKIYQANRNLLSSPEKIQIGQRLLIPSA